MTDRSLPAILAAPVGTDDAESPPGIDERFEVVRVLGEGASARTLLCRDRDHDRLVALKELRVAHLEDWKHLELFEREAKVLSGLRHHAVPQVFESIEREEDGGRARLILVQEYIEGDSLMARMADGPALGQVQIIQLTMGILDVLEYLHGRSPPIYHRDIKPSNIIVRPTGAPVLVDFGSVTHGWRPAAAAGSTVTGTFGYMPPEQLLGQVGPTSDLYALGATLLHLLTGRAPTEFPFDTGRIEVPDDLPAPPPLRRLVQALLQPAPNARPSNVERAREVLLGQLGEQPTALARIDDGAGDTDAGVEPMTVLGSEGPQSVDLGPAPRDPAGPHRAVYDLLTDPFNPFRGASPVGVVGRKIGLGLLSLVTFGVLPIIYFTQRKKRRKQYDVVFREGKRGRGTLVAIASNVFEEHATLTYEFMAAGVSCRGFITYAPAMSKFLAVGDRVSVLYMEQDPARSCIVFLPASARRPMTALPAAGGST